MRKRIKEEALVSSCLAVRGNPKIDVGSEEYKNVRRLRRHGIKGHRFRSGKYFLELNWRKKIAEVLK